MNRSDFTWAAGWRRRVVAAACASILLAACGGGEESPEGEDAGAVDDTSIDTSEDVATDDSANEEPEPDPAEDDAEEAEEEPDEAEEPSNGGPGEHRPPAEAEALADCSTVTESSPGAVIVFPSDHDASWLDAGPGPVTVEVLGCSDTFEANVQYETFHGQNSQPTLSGFTQGGTLGDWAQFSFEETYWTAGDWTIVVFVNDAESGNRVEYDEVTFTVDP